MKWILIFFLVILELLLLLLIIPAGVSLSAGDSYLNVYARALGFVPKFVFDLHIHNDDAAKTAMVYGAACSAAGAAVPKIERFIKVRRREIRIYPEFEGKTSFMLDMTVMALPIQLIVVGIMLYCRWNRLNKDKAV